MRILLPLNDCDKQHKINNALACIAGLMDDTTANHVSRTSRFVKLLVEAMVEQRVYIDEISKWDIETVASASFFHDVGKIAISNSLLSKPYPLTKKDYKVVKNHVHHGVNIIKHVEDIFGNNDFLKHALLFAGSHHEKWNGSGYPKGLAKSDIPLHGRIMAVVDVYDALTSIRPYKNAMPHVKALKIIEDERGNHFDPQIVDVFLSLNFI